jgi:RNA polymerase sigma factor (sigma-70 family)
MAERPRLLVRLLDSVTPDDQGQAWAQLVEAHTDLLLRTARNFGGDHDAVMDRYAFMLDHLRHNHFSRLRRFRSQERGTFEVWLVAVARRLCLDFHRHKYGRHRANAPRDRSVLERAGRRRLADLLGEALDAALLPHLANGGADEELSRKHTSLALASALESLEPRDRLLLRLLFEEELTVKETARLMGFPTQFHVYRRRDQLLARLRLRLVKQGVRGPES